MSTPAKDCLRYSEGWAALSDVIRLTGTGRSTLQGWHKDRHELFIAVCMGVGLRVRKQREQQP